MRVLLTTESYLPYLSGVTVSVDALARGLGARGHDVLVLAPRPAHGRPPEPVGSSGPPPRHAWLPSYQLPRVVPAGYRMPWPVPWASALRQAARFRADVVHAHSPFVTGALARHLARRARAPLVFTHHTRFAHYAHYLGPLSGPGSAVTDAYLRRFWGGCGAILAPSHDLAQELRARLPASPRPVIQVVPTGVDVAGIRSMSPIDPRPGAGWPPDAVVAVSLGRLAPEKSPLDVLDAVAHAAALDPRLRLLVIGGGPSESALRSRALDADLHGRVAFTGALDRADALRRLRGGDVFLFASRSETQGLVLAEALSAGLPAVAVDGPGVPDSVRDGVDGVIVLATPAADRSRRLGSALLGLVRDDARRAAMSERATRDADRFSVERRVTETEAVYRSMLA